VVCVGLVEAGADVGAVICEIAGREMIKLNK